MYIYMASCFTLLASQPLSHTLLQSFSPSYFGVLLVVLIFLLHWWPTQGAIIQSLEWNEPTVFDSQSSHVVVAAVAIPSPSPPSPLSPPAYQWPPLLLWALSEHSILQAFNSMNRLYSSAVKRSPCTHHHYYRHRRDHVLPINSISFPFCYELRFYEPIIWLCSWAASLHLSLLLTPSWRSRPITLSLLSCLLMASPSPYITSSQWAFDSTALWISIHHCHRRCRASFLPLRHVLFLLLCLAQQDLPSSLSRWEHFMIRTTTIYPYHCWYYERRLRSRGG
jgi:hypothetical protein